MYDLIIVGAGPAGLTAAIYALRAKKNVLMIEKMMPGGQVAVTKNIENYPGFEKINGSDLAVKMFEQTIKLGLEIIFAEALEYELLGKIKKVVTNIGVFESRTILLCLGAYSKQLNVENEFEYVGKGLSYCATCDGNFFKDKTVAVVGGGESSMEDVLYLHDLAKKVYVIYRRKKFIGAKPLLNKVNALTTSPNSKVELILNSVVTKLKGEKKLTSILVENILTKKITELEIDGLFVAIGRKPDTELLKNIISLDETGYIITDENMKTSIDGVYAAGDIRKKSLRQIVTACADGAIASISINNFLQLNK